MSRHAAVGHKCTGTYLQCRQLSHIGGYRIDTEMCRIFQSRRIITSRELKKDFYLHRVASCCGHSSGTQYHIIICLASLVRMSRTVHQKAYKITEIFFCCCTEQ